MSAAVGRMNLLELREKYRDLFYRQDWFVGEAFMRILPDDGAPDHPPRRVMHTGRPPAPIALLPHAVDLAHAFVKYPEADIWERYLWCADHDAIGQRVYVGVNNGKFEIHRHLEITERWATPIW